MQVEMIEMPVVRNRAEELAVIEERILARVRAGAKLMDAVKAETGR